MEGTTLIIITVLIAGGGSKKRFPICSRLCSRRCEKGRPTTASVVGKMLLRSFYGSFLFQMSLCTPLALSDLGFSVLSRNSYNGGGQQQQQRFWWQAAARRRYFQYVLVCARTDVRKGDPQQQVLWEKCS